MPAATDTLRLSTAPRLGSRTSQSQCRRVSARNPAPSAPSTSTRGPVRSTSWARCVRCRPRPRPIHRPASLSSAQRARQIGHRDHRGALGGAGGHLARAWHSAARRDRAARSPRAPRRHRRCAGRRPRLCGSCTPSSASSSGCGRGRARVSASSSCSSRQGASARTSASTPWCTTSRGAGGKPLGLDALERLGRARERAARSPALRASCRPACSQMRSTRSGWRSSSARTACSP